MAGSMHVASLIIPFVLYPHSHFANGEPVGTVNGKRLSKALVMEGGQCSWDRPKAQRLV